MAEDAYFHIILWSEDKRQVKEEHFDNKHHHIIEGQAKTKTKKKRQQRGHLFLQHQAEMKPQLLVYDADDADAVSMKITDEAYESF